MNAARLAEAILNSLPDLINISISTGYMILAILLVRALWKDAPKHLLCVMWGIATLRLILPFSIESVFSLIPAAQTIQTDRLRYEGAALRSPAVIDVVTNPVYPQDLSVELDTTVDALQTRLVLLTFIWIAGAALMLLYAGIRSAVLKRKLLTSTCLQHGIKQTDAVDTPFLYGIFKPVIYVPYSVSAEDLEYVIAHERAHIRRGDHLWKPLGFLILSVYWFDPLVWIGYRMFCKDMEAACDEKVIRDMTEDGRRAYSAALLHCSVKRPPVTASPLAFGKVSVKDRIRHVMDYKKPGCGTAAGAVIVCAALALCFLTDPKTPDIADPAFREPTHVQESEDPAAEETELEIGWAWPCDGTRISVPFGTRIHPVSGEIRECDHINIIGETGDPVYAAGSGEIVKAEYSSEYGYYIEIRHTEEICTQYWHLSEMTAGVGQQVLPGDPIGRIGASGMATGPNLGFCLIRDGEYTDPLSLYEEGDHS